MTFELSNLSNLRIIDTQSTNAECAPIQ